MVVGQRVRFRPIGKATILAGVVHRLKGRGAYVQAGGRFYYVEAGQLRSGASGD